jgi:hypothetical protein
MVKAREVNMMSEKPSLKDRIILAWFLSLLLAVSLVNVARNKLRNQD